MDSFSELSPDTSKDKQHQAWCLALQQYLQSVFERAVMLVSGERTWCLDRVRLLSGCFSDEQTLIVSDEIENGLAFKQARTQLGKEYACLIIDAFESIDLDALAAVSGTLCGGGILFLLLPDLNKGRLFENNRYFQSIKFLLKNNSAVYHLNQYDELKDIPKIKQPNAFQSVDAPFLTHQQEQVFTSIKNNLSQKKSTAIVLVADRGRGKSSVLGLLAADLLNSGTKNIIITAPRLSISQPIFFHADRLVNNSKSRSGYLAKGNAEIKFIAPDVLLLNQAMADLLIIDEAAAIPLPMLMQMLKKYPRVIFSSTVHGYEGTGRGFALKFTALLDELSPNWLSLTMTSPVRWAENDPLEKWLNELLYLDAELIHLPDFKDIDPLDLSINLVNRSELMQDKAKLKALFSLLVSAHYRTRPSDFQFILNNAAVRIYTLMHKKKIIAAVLVNQEGHFDERMCAEIYRGRRRPAGHLLAQTLCFHGGCEPAARLTYARIMRIAVHPDLQGNGLGSQLLCEVLKKEAAKVDLIGTSFSVTPPLLKFWKLQNFELMRVGFSRDHVTASHSVVMLKKSESIVFQQLRQRFKLAIAYWLGNALFDMDENIKHILLLESETDKAELSENDWQDINSFAYYLRGYDVCSWALDKFIKKYPAEILCLDDLSKILIIECIQKKQSPSLVLKITGLQGKKQLLKSLRNAVAMLIESVDRRSA